MLNLPYHTYIFTIDSDISFIYQPTENWVKALIQDLGNTSTYTTAFKYIISTSSTAVLLFMRPNFFPSLLFFFFFSCFISVFYPWLNHVCSLDIHSALALRVGSGSTLAWVVCSAGEVHYCSLWYLLTSWKWSRSLVISAEILCPVSRVW